jgi:hypothetical protein
VVEEGTTGSKPHGIDFPDAEGFTPLMRAAFAGQHEIVKGLLETGSNPNSQTPRGTTPLLLAVHAGHRECARTLLESGARPSLGTFEGQLPLHEAVSREDEEATRLLLNFRADPDCLDPRGRAPLHEAARLGYAGVARVLLGHGANPLLRSQDALSWTPWCFAKQQGHGAVLLELRRMRIDQPSAPTRVTPPLPRRGGLRVLLRKFFLQRSELRFIEGFVVRVLPKTDRDRIFQRVHESLCLVGTHAPQLLNRIRRRIPSIWIPGWHFAYGAYDADLGACVLASTYVDSPEVSSAAIAGTIVHEATHARIWRSDYETSAFVRARTERLCYQQQSEFLNRVPGSSELARLAEMQGRVDPIVWSSEALSAARAETLERENMPKWLIRIVRQLS